jgi:hypothetical protein
MATYDTTADAMDIIRTLQKGKHLNILKKCNIYLISKGNLHINETYVGTYNPIFKALYSLYIRQQQMPSRHHTRT